ncbi:MAG: FAD-binding oxidoreductase [Chloroflexi bacterium]|nr:FAD-binding oxidoreductase [Chloroflexota bacterium]
MPQSAIRNPQSLRRLHWLRDLPDEFPVPSEPLPDHADVIIIGGGYMGTSTAMWLGRLGAGAVVIERRGVSTGATGRNAGFIAPGLGQSFHEAVERHGRAGAIDRLNFTRHGRDLALSLIKELGIDCDLEQSGGLAIGSSDEEWAGLRAGGEGLQQAGFPIEILSRDDLAALVETSRGEIVAGRVVLATNAWTPLVAGYLKDLITPVRGQIFATEPAPPAFKRGMSTKYGYEYWSQRADGAIILGGARWAAEDRDEGYYTEELNPTIQSALYTFLTETFPALKGVKLARQWSGIMGFSRDVYPFIGPVPGRERLIAVAGFTGHGGPYAAIAGKCVAELIVRGKSEEPLDHYALDRPLPNLEPEPSRQI